MKLAEDGLRVESCHDCDISTRRKSIVNGFGDTNKGTIVFIGEAPGHKEDVYGIPLIGRSGQLFNTYLTEVGLNRDVVYTTNVIKCRPARNRNPYDYEIENCLVCLKSELRVIEPKVVILLGAVATQTYFQNPRLRVSSIRNKPQWINERLIISIYHPAYILRNKHDDDVLLDYFNAFVVIARAYKYFIDPLFKLKYR